MSARMAEKLVIQFYKSLGHEVEDTSIYQVTNPYDRCWQLADMRIDKKYMLDVKNARKSCNSEVYSEFCVKKFKRDSKNSAVKIVGVLSPYIKSSEKFQDNDKPIKILGELEQCTIESINNFFGQSDMSNEISLEINLFKNNDDSNKYLPPWLFDYNDKFYSVQISIINSFKELHENRKIPTAEDLLIMQKNLESIFPLFIASQRSIPDNWIKFISQWKYRFLLSLITLPVKKLSLPYLFLAILKHFLTMLSEQQSSNEDYNPLKYKDILYTSLADDKPLKLYDPLNIINEFCESLNSIWEFRQKADLSGFKIFKFNGKGLLTGQETKMSKPKILLAYCGGRIDKLNNAKCGNTPLVLGKDKTCEFCYRLICPKCNYCSENIDKKENCEGYKNRKQKHKSKIYELNSFSEYVFDGDEFDF
jgi:hypothetical protein